MDAVASANGPSPDRDSAGDPGIDGVRSADPLPHQRLSQIDRVTGERGRRYRPRIGTAFVHTANADHSRLAYANICADESAATAIAVLQRTVAWFAEHGVAVTRARR
ncbi:putative transposase [Mycolicibacterium hassiacum DSM 44199]|uniref:Putative transposase n=1 Tax=Mycolicibacterium hassiacum (strain DSM 44199 / CIP 105218 / JCM 12690 / 3849) TaxID=1122247 RepID=K5B948_MYCHD|nr:putative transposase [Mycolicibacterium hassiacum DSM 44199]